MLQVRDRVGAPRAVPFGAIALPVDDVGAVVGDAVVLVVVPGAGGAGELVVRSGVGEVVGVAVAVDFVEGVCRGGPSWLVFAGSGECGEGEWEEEEEGREEEREHG